MFNRIPEAVEEQDEKFHVEATSNPDLNNESKSETDNDTVNEPEVHAELSENVVNENEGNLESGNIDAGGIIDEGGSQGSGGCEPGGKEMSVSEERAEKIEEDGMQEEELNKDAEQQFQESIDHLGIISAHHDGYIRFWNYEVL